MTGATSEMTPFQRQLFNTVAGLSPGEVVSFGDVAARAGRPGASRAAGRMLATIKDSGLPWWRVVYSSGKLPPCNPTLQKKRLREEGVKLKRDRVVNAPSGRFES